MRAAMRVLSDLGHGPIIEYATGDESTRCLSCGTSLDLSLVVRLGSRSAIERAIAAVPGCVQALYRPIPGTPWFKYGPFKEAPCPR